MNTISAAFLLVLAVKASSAAVTPTLNYCTAKPEGDICVVDQNYCIGPYQPMPSFTLPCECKCVKQHEKPVEVCCETKTVGAYSYTKHSSGKVPANCLNDCIYTRDGQSGTKYCFASGDLEVNCHKEHSDCTATPQITEIIPDKGSTNGGQLISIIGSGFNPDWISATINGADCYLKSTTTSIIKCITPPGTDNGPSQLAQVVVTSCNTRSNIKNYRYAIASTPTIEKINPNFGPGGEITITGTSFATTIAATTVTARSSDGMTTATCNVDSEPTTGEIKCIMPALKPDVYTIIVKNNDLGLSDPNSIPNINEFTAT